MPQTGDMVVWDNWRFEVVDMDGKRIDKVLASVVAAAPPAENDEHLHE
jgi:putative hemolysin